MLGENLKKGILFSLQKGKGRLDEKIKGEHLLERVKTPQKREGLHLIKEGERSSEQQGRVMPRQ